LLEPGHRLAEIDAEVAEERHLAGRLGQAAFDGDQGEADFFRIGLVGLFVVGRFFGLGGLLFGGSFFFGCGLGFLGGLLRFSLLRFSLLLSGLGFRLRLGVVGLFGLGLRVVFVGFGFRVVGLGFGLRLVGLFFVSS
jgi:hypothetical protein